MLILNIDLMQFKIIACRDISQYYLIYSTINKVTPILDNQIKKKNNKFIFFFAIILCFMFNDNIIIITVEYGSSFYLLL
jgi:hypothetical protein